MLKKSASGPVIGRQRREESSGNMMVEKIQAKHPLRGGLALALLLFVIAITGCGGSGGSGGNSGSDGGDGGAATLTAGPQSGPGESAEICVDTSDCGPNATCTASGCVCDVGFEGDGITCSDIDECRAGTDSCDANANCTNTAGSSSCVCWSGFEGSGESCFDIDECGVGSDSCDANASCTNAQGDYSCGCDPGFAGNGYSCDDIDECATGAASCDPAAFCTNTSGSFSCACPAGMVGDGTVCRTPALGALSIDNVRSTGDSNWGVPSLSLPYTATADGLLVLSASWYDPDFENTPTFGGTPMIHAASGQTTNVRLRVAHGAMYYLPVFAGESGTIQLNFAAPARRPTMTAVTVVGASALDQGLVTVSDVSPAPLEVGINFALNAESMILTLISSSASVDSSSWGGGHVQHANPTQPLNAYHDGRSYSGNALLGAGNHDIGWEQDPAHVPPPSSAQLYESVMVLGVFR